MYLYLRFWKLLSIKLQFSDRDQVFRCENQNPQLLVSFYLGKRWETCDYLVFHSSELVIQGCFSSILEILDEKWTSSFNCWQVIRSGVIGDLNFKEVLSSNLKFFFPQQRILFHKWHFLPSNSSNLLRRYHHPVERYKCQQVVYISETHKMTNLQEAPRQFQLKLKIEVVSRRNPARES